MRLKLEKASDAIPKLPVGVSRFAQFGPRLGHTRLVASWDAKCQKDHLTHGN